MCRIAALPLVVIVIYGFGVALKTLFACKHFVSYRFTLALASPTLKS
jgi:hypothetical protein